MVALSDRTLRRISPRTFRCRRTSPVFPEMILRVEWATEVAVVLGLLSVVQVAAEAMVVAGLLIVLVVAPHGYDPVVAVVATAALLLLPATLTKATFLRYGEREQVLAEQAQQQLRRALAHCAKCRVYGRRCSFAAVR